MFFFDLSFSRKLRIHGDNIIECERTLKLLSEAFNITPQKVESPIFKPKYFFCDGITDFSIELLPGHGRWGIDITDEIKKSGGILREGADSYLTELIDNEEHVLLAIEYCSALPAGNNAWQRNGRAYSSVLAGIPYLYFTEIGGVELDENRNVKAPRFPNPLVPFSYLTVSQRLSNFCIPIYEPHPSISDELYQEYKEMMGHKEGVNLIYGIIMRKDYSHALSNLRTKTLSLVVDLSAKRKRNDTLCKKQWETFLSSKNKPNWLIKKCNITWKKNYSQKVKVSPTFKIFLTKMNDFQCISIGAKTIPICYIPKSRIPEFLIIIKNIYPNININIDTKKGLGIVWVNGFKPEGEDSRPDRGLVPLARMILGNGVPVLTIVYGPAKIHTWNLFFNDINKLIEDNGLWEALYYLSDYLLIDSFTAPKISFQKLNNRLEENRLTDKSPWLRA